MLHAIQPSDGVNTVCMKATTTVEDREHSESPIKHYYEVHNYIPSYISIQDWSLKREIYISLGFR